MSMYLRNSKRNAFIFFGIIMQRLQILEKEILNKILLKMNEMCLDRENKPLCATYLITIFPATPI